MWILYYKHFKCSNTPAYGLLRKKQALTMYHQLCCFLKLAKCPLNPENFFIYTAVNLSYPGTISNYISLIHRLNAHVPMSYCHINKFMRSTLDIFHLFLMINKTVKQLALHSSAKSWRYYIYMILNSDIISQVADV